MSFEEVRRDWTRLATEDPLWAVYVAPGRRGGRWDVDDFLKTGRDEVSRSVARLAQLGLPTTGRLALDFGCGVGRLAQPLAERFAHVVAVDVSAPMLERARSLDRSGGRIEWRLNECPDLSFQPDRSVDLAYSSLVLQHLPRELALGYLRELIRILSPGGVAVVQLATRPLPSLRGWAFRWLPHRLVGLVQTRLLGYPAPMRMTALNDRDVYAAISPFGARVVDKQPDPTYGGHWTYTRYVVRRDS